MSLLINLFESACYTPLSINNIVFVSLFSEHNCAKKAHNLWKKRKQEDYICAIDDNERREGKRAKIDPKKS